MTRDYWCRLCKYRYAHAGGSLPNQCPDCEQDAHWSSEAVPLKDWVLNENDRNFLRGIRIAVNNDGEDDAA